LWTGGGEPKVGGIEKLPEKKNEVFKPFFQKYIQNFFPEISDNKNYRVQTFLRKRRSRTLGEL